MIISIIGWTANLICVMFLCYIVRENSNPREREIKANFQDSVFYLFLIVSTIPFVFFLTTIWWINFTGQWVEIKKSLIYTHKTSFYEKIRPQTFVNGLLFSWELPDVYYYPKVNQYWFIEDYPFTLEELKEYLKKFQMIPDEK